MTKNTIGQMISACDLSISNLKQERKIVIVWLKDNKSRKNDPNDSVQFHYEKVQQKLRRIDMALKLMKYSKRNFQRFIATKEFEEEYFCGGIHSLGNAMVICKRKVKKEGQHCPMHKNWPPLEHVELKLDDH